MRYVSIFAALALAAVSLGIIILFLFIYSAWINGDTDVLQFAGLNVSTPLFLVILAICELFINFILFIIVRRFLIK